MSTNTIYQREICPHERAIDQQECRHCLGTGVHLPELRILTLWQPWASLVAWGEKQWETRGHRFPKWSGWLAIHAAAGRAKPVAMHTARKPYFTEAMQQHQGPGLPRPDLLPNGCVLCVVYLGTPHPTTKAREFLSEKEVVFGDYGPDRLAMPLTYLQPLREPLKMSNGQGLRHATREQKEAILRSLR